jgi:hypothetical protein
MRVLKIAPVAGGVAVAALGAAALIVCSSARVSTVGELEFANELRIPPLAEPRVGADGRKVFDLEHMFHCPSSSTRTAG